MSSSKLKSPFARVAAAGMAAAVMAAIIGCSTTPDEINKQTRLDPSMVDAPSRLWNDATAAGLVKVRIARDSGMIGGACAFAVYVNNEPIARLFPGSFVEVAMPPGQHEVYVTHGGIICPPRTSNQVRFTFSPDSSPVVRLGIRDTFPFVWPPQ